MGTEPKSLAPSGELEDEMIDVRGARIVPAPYTNRSRDDRGEYEVEITPYLLAGGEIDGSLVVQTGIKFEKKTPKGRPPFYLGRIVLPGSMAERSGSTANAIDLHLFDGVTPADVVNGVVSGRIEVKARQTAVPERGGEIFMYHVINVRPGPGGTATVRIVYGDGDWGKDSNGFGVRVTR